MNARLSLRIAAAALSCFAVLGLNPATARADSVDSGSKVVGDCTLRVRLIREYNSNASVAMVGAVNVRTQGQIVCTRRHDFSVMTSTQKMNGATQSMTSTAPWTNSYGTGPDRWVTTATVWRSYWGVGCDQYQGIFTINGSGLGGQYVTTGAPLTICDH